MRTIYKQLKQNSKMLEMVEENFNTANTLPYYSIFGNIQEKKKDLSKIEETKRELLNERHTILENMQMEIRKELNIVSQKQRFKIA